MSSLSRDASQLSLTMGRGVVLQACAVFGGMNSMYSAMLEMVIDGIQQQYGTTTAVVVHMMHGLIHAQHRQQSPVCPKTKTMAPLRAKRGFSPQTTVASYDHGQLITAYSETSIIGTPVYNAEISSHFSIPHFGNCLRGTRTVP